MSMNRRYSESKNKIFSMAQISYLLISTLTIIPLINPAALLFREISPNTQTIYNYIERELNAEAAVLIDLHHGSLTRAGLEPQLSVIVKHFFEKKCKIVFISTSYAGPDMFKQFKFTASEIFTNKQYGSDYAFLGSISGGETAVAALARSICETVSKDYYNISVTNYAELPLMKTVNKAEDFALAFILSVETEVFDWYVRHWASRGISLLFGTLSATVSSAEIHMKNGETIGVIAGQKATAEYEILVGKTGQGFAAIKNRNLAYIFVTAFMFFGNMTILYWKLKPKSLSHPDMTEHG